MDSRLKSLIDLFIEGQHHVIRVLTVEIGIDLPQHPLAGHLCLRPENRRKLIAANVQVFPHGFGLCFHAEGFWIDFDFGVKGELGGFDAHRLYKFNLNNQLGIAFHSPEEIKTAMQHAVNNGEIIFCKPINYFIAPTKH
jgi:hypothetical protein